MTNSETLKTHLESSRSLLRRNETLGIENMAERGIHQGEHKRKVNMRI